ALCRAAQHRTAAATILEGLGAAPDRADARAALNHVPSVTTGGYVGVQVDGDAALVRRLVDAAAIPALLARDGATALLEACDAQAVVLFVRGFNGQVQLLGTAGCDAEGGRALAAAAHRGSSSSVPLAVEPIGVTSAGGRFAAVSAARSLAGQALQRFRTLCAVLRQ